MPSSYRLPFLALSHLIDAGVSCNACVMVSFSTDEGIASVKEQLAEVHPGILKSVELEKITMFPKVAQRLAKAGLKPLRAKRIRGKKRGAQSHDNGAAGHNSRAQTGVV